MWVYTIDITSEFSDAADCRFPTQEEAEAHFTLAQSEQADLNPRNLREEPDDYVPIEERNATPQLFPGGITCRSQMSPR
jgi:hypothetical protein